VAVLYLYESHKAATAASSSTDPTTGALAAQGANAAQYGYTAPDIASMLQQLQGQVSLLGGGNNGTTATTPTSPGSTGTAATANPAPAGAPTPGAGNISAAGFQQIQNPTLAGNLLARGYDIVQFGTAVYYEPSEKPTPGKGQSLIWISSPSLSKELAQAGYAIKTLGTSGHMGQYYAPTQKVGK
jgi:hypothetical protein